MDVEAEDGIWTHLMERATQFGECGREYSTGPFFGVHSVISLVYASGGPWCIGAAHQALRSPCVLQRGV